VTGGWYGLSPAGYDAGFASGSGGANDAVSADNDTLESSTNSGPPSGPPKLMESWAVGFIRLEPYHERVSNGG
jgi:hypothetical protein